MVELDINSIRGATMIEYVLIVGLISVVAVALLTTIGGGIQTMLTTVQTALAPGP